MSDQNWRDEIDVNGLVWETPSTIGNCVELARHEEWILVRDTKEPDNRSSWQRYGSREVATFISGAKSGFFDDLLRN